MATVTGTFTGAGASDSVSGKKMDARLRFVGTATVQLESKMPSGNWMVEEANITTDYHKVIDVASFIEYRFNCTAHTQDVEYAIQRG